jgi:guanylate kinase
VQGASSLRKTQSKYEFLKKKIQSVFIAPANLNDLRLRLEKRGQDSKEEIENRLATAANEICFSDQFDFIINSKTKDHDYEQIAKIYREQSNLIKEKSIK